jgi:copper homeostasis protein CutC
MACGGITHNNAASIIERTGVSEIHVGLSSAVVSPMLYRNRRVSLGKAPGREYQRMQVLEENIRKLQRTVSLARLSKTEP